MKQITLSHAAICLNDCHQHGVCIEPHECHCEPEWTGRFCSRGKLLVSICTGHKLLLLFIIMCSKMFSCL